MFEHGQPRGSHTITSPDTEPRLQAGQREALWKLGRKGITLLINAGLMCISTLQSWADTRARKVPNLNKSGCS